MSKFSFNIFAIWFLALPFTVITSYYFGVIAIDKILAPALLILWASLLPFGYYRLTPGKLSILFIAFCFFLIRNISFIDNTALFYSLLWEDAVHFGYFCLPILYINNLNNIKTSGKLISVNATIGCVSAFMVAIGLLTLPYERFSQSRIGFDIQKSIGLFSSYGDLAQYAACFIVMAIFAPSMLISAKRQKTLLVITAFIIIIMGLIGNQSRSYFLSLIVAVFLSALFYYFSGKRINRILFNLSFAGIGIGTVSLVAYLFTDIVKLLSSLGGSQAEATAHGRLKQYQMAFDFIREYPVMGVDSAVFSKHSEYIQGIHNMWLGQLSLGGFVSAFILAGLMLQIFNTASKLLYNPQVKEYAIMSIGYIFATLTATLFYPADTSLFWALLGMNAAIIYTLRTVR